MPQRSQKPLAQQATQGRFGDKVVLLTGASPRGIGGATALRLAGEGAAVCMLSRNEPVELLKKIDALERAAQWNKCDVAAQADVDRAVDSCIDHFGKIDVVINNAGVETAKPFRELTDDEWQELVDVNLTGVIRVTRAALPHLEFNGGVVVNVSSASGCGGTPGLSAYSATKAGLNGLTQSLAIELAAKRIRVVGVAPALVRTPMAARHVESISAEGWEKIQQCHPLGIGKPQDVAATIAFLASDEAKWITGITIPLGWLPSYPLPFDD